MLDPEAEPGGSVCDEESSTRNLPANGAPPSGVNHFGGEDGMDAWLLALAEVLLVTTRSPQL